MTKKGEYKTGLSMYYVRFTHHLIVFCKMLQQIAILAPNLKQRAKDLEVESEKWKDFLTCKYSHHHLSMNGNCKSLNCKHTVSTK